MKALEIKAKTDKDGRLQIEQDLKQANLAVRVLILFHCCPVNPDNRGIRLLIT